MCNDLFVIPFERSAGIATAIKNEQIVLAQKEGCKWMFSSFDANNVPLQKIYDKLGAEITVKDEGKTLLARLRL